MPLLQHQRYKYGSAEAIAILEAENKRLNIALADAVLAKDVLECLIEEVDAHYGTDVKKFWISTVRRRSEEKHQPVKWMCRYFDYSRSAYYKSLKMNERTTVCETLITDMVRRERRIQPRLDGKKLYHMLGDDSVSIPLFLAETVFLACRAEMICRWNASVHTPIRPARSIISIDTAIFRTCQAHYSVLLGYLQQGINKS